MASVTSRAWRGRSPRGAELVELAIGFPLLMLVLMGIIDFSLLFQQNAVITNAAREGARIASLPHYRLIDGQARAQEYVAATLATMGNNATVSMPVQTNITTGTTAGCAVTVTVSYPHRYLFLAGIGTYFGRSFGTTTLTASATMRRETSTGSC